MTTRNPYYVRHTLRADTRYHRAGFVGWVGPLPLKRAEREVIARREDNFWDADIIERSPDVNRHVRALYRYRAAHVL